MTSARDIPSILPGGAYGNVTPVKRFFRTPDPGAPGWYYEPSIKIIQNQYLKEKNVPLWNPYSAYGTPLAADMISQPFNPLSILLSLHPTIKIYDLFIIFRLFLAGIFTYLFLRLFINKAPSLFGSIAFMFTGYFILYLNMPHLSVEILLPAVFYFFEILLKKSSLKTLVFSSLVIFLTIIGGMPESTFLVLSFGYIYYLFRLFTDLSLRVKKWVHIKNFVYMNVLGFALSALLLFPFLEFMKYSFDTHQTSNTVDIIRGIQHDKSFPSVLVYLIPMIFGPIFNSVFDRQVGIIGYWGILPFLFAVLCVMAYFRLKRDMHLSTLNLIVIFFFCSAVLIIMKRFGFILINWIGYLPLSNMIAYTKYQEPLLGFAVAVLSGIGFSLLENEKLKQKYFIPAAAITAGIILSLVIYWTPTIIQYKYKSFTYLNIALAVFLIVSLIVLYRISHRNFQIRYRFQHILIVALSAELFINFLLPSFYLNNLPDRSADPYKGAPYIDFLKENNEGHYRVFGREKVLYPNWSGVFGLHDVRHLNAMHVKKYITFVRNFLLPEDVDLRSSGDLSDRFTGEERDYSFNTQSERRFLQLSSVKYLLSNSPYNLQPQNQSTSEQTSDLFKKVYDDEIKMYEVPDILPRASVFYRAELLDQDDRILSRLKDPSLDIRQSVLVFSGDLNSKEKDFISNINNLSPRQAHGAEILSYESQKVVIRANLSQPGILMLNDTSYPGWKAYVDGRKAKVLNTNYLFRGVLLEEGQHTVEFRYEPVSFRLGLLISAVSLAATTALFLRKEHGRQVNPPKARRCL